MNRTLKAAVCISAIAAAAAPAVIRRADRGRRAKEGLKELALPHEDLDAVSTDGTRLSVRACGEGPEAVFLAHGWTCDESIFRYQQEKFSSRYRVVTFDQRGHGRSAMPESLDYSTERQAEDLKAVIDLVGPSSFVVAGHSMGGFAAFKFFELFGADYAGRLKGMAIIDSTGTDLMEGIVFGRFLRMLPPSTVDALLDWLSRHNRAAGRAVDTLRNTAAAYLVVRWAAFGRSPCGEHVEHLREMVTGTSLASVFLAAKACADYHCDYSLPRISVPVALLVGDRDKLTDLDSNRRTASLIPDARLKVYPGAGHCTLLERRDEFDADLGAFLSEVFADGQV